MQITINGNAIDNSTGKNELLAHIKSVKAFEAIQISNDYGGHLIFVGSHNKRFSASYGDYDKPESYDSVKNFTPEETVDIILRYMKSSYWNDGIEFEINQHETQKNKWQLERTAKVVEQHRLSQALTTNQENQQPYSMAGWIVIVTLTVAIATGINIAMDPSGKKERIEKQLAIDLKKIEAEKEREITRKARIEEGLKARDDFDQAMRAEAEVRRARLKKASKSVRTTNSHGVRVDQYILKKGGIVSCTTAISSNSPAIFNCDGDV